MEQNDYESSWDSFGDYDSYSELDEILDEIECYEEEIRLMEEELEDTEMYWSSDGDTEDRDTEEKEGINGELERIRATIAEQQGVILDSWELILAQSVRTIEWEIGSWKAAAERQMKQ